MTKMVLYWWNLRGKPGKGCSLVTAWRNSLGWGPDQAEMKGNIYCRYKLDVALCTRHLSAKHFQKKTRMSMAPEPMLASERSCSNSEIQTSVGKWDTPQLHFLSHWILYIFHLVNRIHKQQKLVASLTVGGWVLGLSVPLIFTLSPDAHQVPWCLGGGQRAACADSTPQAGL